jgi:hypothetical protein
MGCGCGRQRNTGSRLIGRSGVLRSVGGTNGTRITRTQRLPQKATQISPITAKRREEIERKRRIAVEKRFGK